jgi:hypothetical protein
MILESEAKTKKCPIFKENCIGSQCIWWIEKKEYVKRSFLVKEEFQKFLDTHPEFEEVSSAPFPTVQAWIISEPPSGNCSIPIIATKHLTCD